MPRTLPSEDIVDVNDEPRRKKKQKNERRLVPDERKEREVSVEREGDAATFKVFGRMDGGRGKFLERGQFSAFWTRLPGWERAQGDP